MKSVCFKEKCVYRTLTENGIHYCPFGICPFNKPKKTENDKKINEQTDK